MQKLVHLSTTVTVHLHIHPDKKMSNTPGLPLPSPPPPPPSGNVVQEQDAAYLAHQNAATNSEGFTIGTRQAFELWLESTLTKTRTSFTTGKISAYKNWIIFPNEQPSAPKGMISDFCVFSAVV